VSIPFRYKSNVKTTDENTKISIIKDLAAKLIIPILVVVIAAYLCKTWGLI